MRVPRPVAVVRDGDGEVVCGRCSVAATMRTRLKGLLGRPELPRGEGLLLQPASSIHTAFMQFPIDAVFLDRDRRVLRVARDLPPWRSASRRRARAVLELPAGECERQEIRVGDRLAVRADDDRPATAAPPRPRPRLAFQARSIPGAATAACAVALGAGVLIRDGLGARGAISAFVVAVLVVLAAIDLQRGILPNRIVLPAAVATLAAQLAFFPGHAVEWISASLGAFAFFLVLHVVNPRGMGLGDAKLALLLGAALGGSVVTALLLASLFVFPFALAVVLRRAGSSRNAALPFGPFLALGAIVVLYLPST